ncbi:amphiphysin isoform X2 [Phycodurus eques]|uniref:amphiphysin isoform X2 n=1 Tax=Phycodurus eques TaxID=693459 RepID=UPI002ACED283|nr:amphiphysin isoform X2 [Phycodurus eques]
MADIKTGIFAKNVQKRLNRAQEKVLQKLGKADETKDEQFEQVVINFRRQECEGSRLQREMKAYMSAIKGMQQASINLTQSLHEVYEPDWHGKDDVMTIGKDCDALWENFHNKLVDSTLLNLDAYLLQFPDLKTRVAKRSRKLIDYDSARHHVETLQTTGMKNDRKILKADEELRKAQRVFDELNAGLQDELPTLWDSRVGFYISTFKSVTSLEARFHREIYLVCKQLYEVMMQLSEQHADKMFTIQGAPSDAGPLRLARTPSPPEDESPPESPDAGSNHMLRPVSPGPPRPKSPMQGPPVPPPPKVTPSKEVVEEQIIDLFGGEFLPAPSPLQPNERPGESLLDMDFDAFQPDESVSPVPQTVVPWDTWSAQSAQTASESGFVADWSADFSSATSNGEAAAGEAATGAPEGTEQGDQGGEEDRAMSPPPLPPSAKDSEAAEDEVSSRDDLSETHPNLLYAAELETGQAESEGNKPGEGVHKKSTPGLLFTDEFGKEIEDSSKCMTEKWSRSPEGSGSEYETAEEWADGVQCGGWASADDEPSREYHPDAKNAESLPDITGSRSGAQADKSLNVEENTANVMSGNAGSRDIPTWSERQEGGVFDSDPFTETQGASKFHNNRLAETQEGVAFESDAFTETQGGGAFDSDPFAETQAGGALQSDPFAERQEEGASELDYFADIQGGGAFDSDPFAETQAGGAFQSDPFAERQEEGASELDSFADIQGGGAFDSDPFAETEAGGAFQSDPFAERQEEGASELDSFADIQGGGAFDSDPFAETEAGGALQSDPFAERQEEGASELDSFADIQGGGAFDSDPFAETEAGGALQSDPFAERQEEGASELDSFADIQGGGAFDSDPFAETLGRGVFDSDPFAETQAGGALDSDPFNKTHDRGALDSDPFANIQGGGVFDSDPFAETIGSSVFDSEPFAETHDKGPFKCVPFGETQVGDKADCLRLEASLKVKCFVVSGGRGSSWEPFANSLCTASSDAVVDNVFRKQVGKSSCFDFPNEHRSSTTEVQDVNLPQVCKEPESSDISEDEAANLRFGKMYQAVAKEKEEDAPCPSLFADFDQMASEMPNSAPPAGEEPLPVHPAAEENTAVSCGSPLEENLSDLDSVPVEKKQSPTDEISETMAIPSVVIEPASSNEGDDDRDADIISPSAIGDNGVVVDKPPIKPTSSSPGGLPGDFLYKVETMHDFEAANSDELDLKQGDVVLVLPTASVEDQEAGWLTGFKQSDWMMLGIGAQKGLFPENFTQRLE